MIGTLRYASPEQLRGDPVTTATDVFGLGVMLCEMAAGAHPFDHGNHALPVFDDPFVPAAVPVDLAAIVRMALRPEPGRRYASAVEFADDVRRYRRGLPVNGQRTKTNARSRKGPKKTVGRGKKAAK